MLTLSQRSTPLPVELVEWPEQAGLRKALAHAGVPRVLLVDIASPLPPGLGVDEDWVWSNATDEHIAERARAVLRKLRRPALIERRTDGTWSHAGHVFRLPRLQARLLAELAEHRGTAVPRERLVEVAWPGRRASRRPLEVAIGRLRDGLVGTGLYVRPTRGVGYQLD